MNYPNQSGYVDHSTTSRDSARKLDKSGMAASYEDLIMKILRKAGTEGATAEEARIIINHEYPNVHNGTINGRMSTMWRRGTVIKTSLKRKTSGKRKAHVYALAEYRGHFEARCLLEPDYAAATGIDPALTPEAREKALAWLDTEVELGCIPQDVEATMRAALKAGV